MYFENSTDRAYFLCKWKFEMHLPNMCVLVYLWGIRLRSCRNCIWYTVSQLFIDNLACNKCATFIIANNPNKIFSSQNNAREADFTHERTSGARQVYRKRHHQRTLPQSTDASSFMNIQIIESKLSNESFRMSQKREKIGGILFLYRSLQSTLTRCQFNR